MCAPCCAVLNDEVTGSAQQLQSYLHTCLWIMVATKSHSRSHTCTLEVPPLAFSLFIGAIRCSNLLWLQRHHTKECRDTCGVSTYRKSPWRSPKANTSVTLTTSRQFSRCCLPTRRRLPIRPFQLWLIFVHLRLNGATSLLRGSEITKVTSGT
jgi:hypothetical protein